MALSVILMYTLVSIRRIWACECLDDVFRGMRGSHDPSMFHYERIRCVKNKVTSRPLPMVFF